MKQIKGAYHDITGAIMTEETGEYCDVLTIHFHNADEQTTGGHFGISTYIKYVVNHNHQDIGGGKTIADYETYVAAVHERYLAKPADGVDAHRWRNWDHFLDAHIGLKFQGLASDADVETSHAVTDDVDRIYLQDTCLSTNEAVCVFDFTCHTCTCSQFLSQSQCATQPPPHPTSLTLFLCISI